MIHPVIGIAAHAAAMRVYDGYSHDEWRDLARAQFKPGPIQPLAFCCGLAAGTAHRNPFDEAAEKELFDEWWAGRGKAVQEGLNPGFRKQGSGNRYQKGVAG